ncbi:MAG: sulfotransferase [Nocardioides sp.]|uniref:sulfotransferase family protein n=1 Tax=Nocardioides sp. TaxID=35761 RepID=UPI0039E5A971
MNGPLPDFVGIGALKAGTTYLDQLLRGHPQLSFPRHLKETEFFTRHYRRGPEWYAGLFAPPDGRLRGEISPQYLPDPTCAERLYAANPEALLIATLRDPVARLVSQYRHFAQVTGYPGDLRTFLVEHPGAIDRGRYHAQLQPWLARFGRDRLHLVIFDDLVDSPLATARSVLAFLGVDDSVVPSPPDAETYSSFSPRFPRAYVRARRVSAALRGSATGRAVVGLAQRAGLRGLLSTPAAQAREGELSAGERAELATGYRADAARLGELLDRDLVRLWGLEAT